MKINNSNDHEFNIVGKSNLTSVHELISTYGMEAMPQAMEILFNEARLIERAQHLGAGRYECSNNRLDYIGLILMVISQNELRRVLVG